MAALTPLLRQRESLVEELLTGLRGVYNDSSASGITTLTGQESTVGPLMDIIQAFFAQDSDHEESGDSGDERSASGSDSGSEAD